MASEQPSFSSWLFGSWLFGYSPERQVVRITGTLGEPQFVPAHTLFDDPGHPKVQHIAAYVINLDTRPDRLQCMRSQLHGAPVATFRQPAVPKAACANLKKDWSVMWGDRDHDAEMSLFCSNYQVWRQAEASHAEFIVIMEDDVVLLNISGTSCHIIHLRVTHWTTSAWTRPT
uniref:Glycosyl transferase family 25 domain-containing protein n=1 Tax=Noctiluca scintillans TaxID=2966 RepID=A0A7S1AIF8_NOCSC